MSNERDGDMMRTPFRRTVQDRQTKMPETLVLRNRTRRASRAARIAALAGMTFVADSALAASARAQAGPQTANYWIYVLAESADLMHRVRFGPDGATVERTISVGLYPTETEGPHGVSISADGRWLHMTTGHGLPDGGYWKYEIGPDTVVGPFVPLGNFPATIDVTPDGLYAFIVNFNLHGEHEPSSVSVVYTGDNVEVARTTTCVMPHGSRMGNIGIFHYSVCMMDDQLVEIDTRTFEVSRRFSVAKGAEAPIAPAGGHAQHMAGAGAASGRDMVHEPTCSPTWAQPAANGRHIFVACNRSDEILEIDLEAWTLRRSMKTGRAPYNLAVSPDGKSLVVTLKAARSVEFIDLTNGRSLGSAETSTTVVHGVVISPDSKYAFVSVEGVGAEPGKVDIFDIAARTRVASVEVGQQASGIAFWKMEPALPERPSSPAQPSGRATHPRK
jgi:DNA-binding beta-propeller fold protein YncE